MTIIIHNPTFNKTKIHTCNAVPRIGETVDVFYEPSPKVKDVLWYPSKNRKKEIGWENVEIEAIVLVE